MPLYDWRCNDCQTMNEIIRPSAEYNKPPDQCSDCGGCALTQIISRPKTVKGFILIEGGAGGFHNFEYTRNRSIK